MRVRAKNLPLLARPGHGGKRRHQPVFAYYPQAYIGQSPAQHPDGFGSGVGQVNHTAFVKRPPVVDSDNDGLLVGFVGHFYQRVEG